jgi:hypothetical protein
MTFLRKGGRLRGTGNGTQCRELVKTMYFGERLRRAPRSLASPPDVSLHDSIPLGTDKNKPRVSYKSQFRALRAYLKRDVCGCPCRKSKRRITVRAT